MSRLRSTLFWLHLAAGLIAGLFIGVMCFTGTVLAFEHEIVAWAERDARQITAPADTARLPLADLQRKLSEARPEFRATSITLLNNPATAVTFAAGRDENIFANPYTGEFLIPSSTKVRDFMHLMTDWHRFLGREGTQRPLGKLVNGICNLAFFVLAVTGLYLWMPRTWSWSGVKAVALFNWKAAGKARDFNWHNVIGLWSAPILIVLTLTAVPISFRWGGNLIFLIVGEAPPAPGGAAPSPRDATPAAEIKRPSPESKPLAHDTLLATVQQDFPRWAQITLRTATPQRGAPPASAQSGGAATPSREGRSAPQLLTITIRESGSWPRTATTTLTLNPFTGEILKREGFADFSPARQIRTWTRYLHTGQALGWPGQLVAGLACLGGCFLVYTGFALSYRRFFGQRHRAVD